jgi:hypothetical protein
LGDIIEDTAGRHDGEKGDSSEHLRATMPKSSVRERKMGS